MGDGGIRLALLLLASVIVVPLVIAAATTGEITTQGAAQFPPSSTAAFTEATLFLNDTSQIQGLSAAAAPGTLAHVCEYELREAEIGLEDPLFHTPTPANPPPRCYDATGFNATIIPGDHAGWCGFHPSGGSWAITPSRSIEPRTTSRLASEAADTASTRQKDIPERPWFVKETVGPHVYLTHEGTAVARGPVQLKCMGPDFSLRSAANASEYRTENTVTSGPARERTQRWLVVDFDSAEIVIESRAAPFQIAAPQASVEWDGEATLTAESGSIRAVGADYPLARGEATTIDGQLSALVKPTIRGDGLDVTFQGEARAVSMGSVRVTLPEASPPFPWLRVFVAVGVVGSGGAVVALLHRRRQRNEAPASVPPAASAPPPGTTPPAVEWTRPDIVPAPPPFSSLFGQQAEYAMRANEAALKAHEAADERHWDVACDLMAKARCIMERPDLAYWHGWYLYRASRFQPALLALDVASYGMETGEPERIAALCVVAMMDETMKAEPPAPGSSKEAEIIATLEALEQKGTYYLVRALERAQRRGLVDEINADEDFQEWLFNSDVKEALHHARGRFH